MVNLNTLAEKVTKAEGKTKNLSIAQVKEVMKLVFTEMSELTLLEAVSLIKKYSKTKTTRY
jgi:hypothetical protein